MCELNKSVVFICVLVLVSFQLIREILNLNCVSTSDQW